MKWLWTTGIALILLMLPQIAFAHTGLETASPSENELIKEPLTEIRLKFNTDIETLSRITLKDEQENEIAIAVEIDQDTMTGTLDKPLDNGKYTVNWSIMGEDTHVIKGNYTFTVDAPVVEPPKEEAKVPEPAPLDSQEDPAAAASTHSSAYDNGETAQTASPDKKTSETTKQTSYSWIYYVVGAVLLLFVLDWILGKRRKQQS
ncbi:copper resistance CopC family protein [Paenibacillus spongiae]|uniref:Copper resistance protein CopC n=1 Tax=Paenibacillus spongiae TaxID=2909671 RepID=A0ABY5SL94_9BACL|nr:copper resistance protein CopC [Paenibacillus spongiae]UVI33285.1 copper resistance protein CopC [Paenibacillus spongiae]